MGRHALLVGWLMLFLVSSIAAQDNATSVAAQEDPDYWERKEYDERHGGDAFSYSGVDPKVDHGDADNHDDAAEKTGPPKEILIYGGPHADGLAATEDPGHEEQDGGMQGQHDETDEKELGELNQQAQGGMPDQEQGGMPDQEQDGMPDQEQGGMPDQEQGGMPDQEQDGKDDQKQGGKDDQEQGGMPDQEQDGKDDQEQGGMHDQAQGGMHNQAQGGWHPGQPGNPRLRSSGSTCQKSLGLLLLLLHLQYIFG